MNAMTVFLNLKGTWDFQRTLLGRNPAALLGTLEGSASFRATDDFTLHYKEEGVLTRPSGEIWQAFREYFYVYNKETDSIETYFSENGEFGGLFYILTFIKENSATVAKATGNHLCTNDLYVAEYKFDLQNGGTRFSRFELTYDVTGPRKDYQASTIFEKTRL